SRSCFSIVFDHDGAPFNGPVHPHSGIGTPTYVAEAAVSCIDPDGVKGTPPAGGFEGMQAGRSTWHGGGLSKAGRTRHPPPASRRAVRGLSQPSRVSARWGRGSRLGRTTGPVLRRR